MAAAPEKPRHRPGRLRQATAGWSPLPPSGPLRTVAGATLVNTVGTGLWSAGAAVFLTRNVGLSAAEVGLGLGAAGLAGLTASVPLGRLADRRDPRRVRAVLQVMQGCVACAYLFIGSFPAFLLVAVLDALLVSGNLPVRAALISAVAGPTTRVRAFAAMRAVANIGISTGAGLAAVALLADTRLGYLLLVGGNALTYLISAGLLMRLPSMPRAAAAPPPSARGVLRDWRFLLVSAAAAVLGLHQVLLALVLPLWIVGRTSAPTVMISVVLLTNTALTVLLAVRLSTGAESAFGAARMLRRASWLLAVALLLYAATGTVGTAAAVILLVGATLVFTLGDLLQSTGSAALAYGLASTEAVGAYQGGHQLIADLVQAGGTTLLVLLLIDGPSAGWLLLAGVFVLTGLATPALTARALRTATWSGGAG